jgi:outer membrane receptor protein involved in Fe transport
MAHAQSYDIKGRFLSETGEPIIYANVLLYSSNDSLLTKAGNTDDLGVFTLSGVPSGNYFLESTYIGYENFQIKDLKVEGRNVELGEQILYPSSVQLEEAVVTAQRAMVEVKPDRTVFNVEGTINSTGDNGLGLLRKAPGVLVDNNDNITVLSRSGVLIYVDGKRLPLAGDDLKNYLENLPAEQIDRMDIITNPGAKYEAQGNAGIIDIRLKKDKNLGSNGIVNGTLAQGQLTSANIGISGNYRNKSMNTFGSLSSNNGNSFHEMYFENFQNNLFLAESNYFENESKNISYRIGTDFFLSKNQTIGFLVSGQDQNGSTVARNQIEIATIASNSSVDSILLSPNTSESNRNYNTYNLNYVFDNSKMTVNIDVDYGRYRNRNDYYQPNQYYNGDQSLLLLEINTEYTTPVDIDIYTFRIDVENEFAGGRLGYGTKWSKVKTDNTFLFYDIPEQTSILNDNRSNQFIYDENVYAGYVNFSRQLGSKWSFSSGLRMEVTDAMGDLIAFRDDLQEPPIHLDYTNFFPSIGLTYQMSPENVFSLNYGKRINRPDYNVLNPFKEQQSELSSSKGNPFLNPEIVNNVELGYTLKYRYNFKLSYSRTDDQITRLIAPDDSDPRANFISWENLARQTLYSFNVSAPVDINNWWSMFTNFNSGYVNNQADYGDGAVVDVQAWTYSIFQQNTFKLPGGFTGEISGYFSGPGVWGGVFKYDENWSLNFGLQKKFLNDNLNVRLSVNDVFYKTGWRGASEFNGLVAVGRGNWDSRRGSLSLSYSFGNNRVKSRKRNTGIEDESSRVK